MTTSHSPSPSLHDDAPGTVPAADVAGPLPASEADRLLATAVANVTRDYPVHWTHFISSPAELVPQRDRHPVFAGSYDWHSCVHQSWLMVRMLRLLPDLPSAREARETLDRLVTPEGCRIEAEFFAEEAGSHWERPYGWAWLLVLDAELATWSAAGGTAAAAWRAALRPLTDVLRDRWLGWISKATLPMRVGTHQNSAFATSLVLDAARATGDDELATACVGAALRWYSGDAGYGGFEPDAADFLSPALVEADLMRACVTAGEFVDWFERFLPDLDTDRWATLREPVAVTDPSDPHGSHLSGLALSRAWCWRHIANALPADHRFAGLARDAATAHAEAGRRYVFGYGYAAEHWLGSFATYLNLGALGSIENVGKTAPDGTDAAALHTAPRRA